MRHTRRSGETPDNVFVEDVQGDSPSSIEISLNSKGQVQYSAKLYYPTVEDLLNQSAGDWEVLHDTLRERLERRGIPLAGS